MHELKIQMRMVRLIAILLCLASLQKIWAENRNNTNPQSYEKITEAMPYYGRGWMHLAMERLALKESSGRKISLQDWKEIKPLLDKAYQQERNGAWINYQYAIQLMSHDGFLSSTQRNLALAYLRKSISLHYAGQTSPYLKPALSFLWKQYSDVLFLQKITPRDNDSYFQLMQVTEQRKISQSRDEISKTFLELNAAAYDKQCDKGDEFFQNRDFERAFLEYRKCFWVNKSLSRARSGMSAAQAELGIFIKPEDYA